MEAQRCVAELPRADCGMVAEGNSYVQSWALAGHLALPVELTLDCPDCCVWCRGYSAWGSGGQSLLQTGHGSVMSPDAGMAALAAQAAAQHTSCLPQESHSCAGSEQPGTSNCCPLHAGAGLGQPSWAAPQLQEPWWGQTGWLAVMATA